MKEFGDDLRSKLWGGHLWNPSYFVATVSENTEEQIIEYIRSQKRKQRINKEKSSWKRHSSIVCIQIENKEYYQPRLFGCTRFVYNHYLAKRRDAYEKDGITLNYTACAKDLVSLKKEYEWLKEVDSVALQSSVKNLDTAYINFFKKKAEYPRFKSKKTHRYSYTTKYTNGNIELYENKVKLPKIGLVKIKKTRAPKGRLLSATISQVPSGKYYVSLCYTDVEEVLFPLTYNETGIDLGIKDFIVLSNGEKVENPKYLKKSIEKLKKLQKQQSRKTKGSRNWIKKQNQDCKTS